MSSKARTWVKNQRERRQAEEMAPKLAGDRVFEAASDLFYREGIRAVGVDAIAKKANVAKISLYRNFASKDELMIAYLKGRGAHYWKQWDGLLAKHDGNPQAQFLAILQFIADRVARTGYRGCPFLNCAIEFPEVSHPGHRLAVTAKKELRRRLLRLVTSLDVSTASTVADSILLLVEGAYAISQTLSGPKGPGKSLVWAAQMLMRPISSPSST